jgi:hypothetical protein
MRSHENTKARRNTFGGPIRLAAADAVKPSDSDHLANSRNT